jgi:hypothetical protein
VLHNGVALDWFGRKSRKERKRPRLPKGVHEDRMDVVPGSLRRYRDVHGRNRRV